MKNKVALITGIAGGLSRLVGAELAALGLHIVGVDYRPLTQSLGFDAEVYRANYNKTRIEDIFRRFRPTYVLHLGRVGNLKEQMGKRFDLNVIGSRKIMDLCLKYQTQRLLVLSTFHIYGAHPHNHTPIYEDEPLRAGLEFPQIGDAIQLDNQALMWIYRQPEVQTVLLRPCNVLGPHIKNTMSRFFCQKMIPQLLGFDPMVQFIFEHDMVSAIIKAALGEAVGVFNVAGGDAIPVSEAFALAPSRKIPIPSSLAFLYLKLSGAIHAAIPPYMVNFFKYPCIISDEHFRETFGWKPRWGPVEAIKATVGT